MYSNRNYNLKILKNYKLYAPNNLDTIIAGISILKLIASNCVRIVGGKKAQRDSLCKTNLNFFVQFRIIILIDTFTNAYNSVFKHSCTLNSCGGHSVDTKSEIVRILHFKQFYKHFVFNEDGDGGRKKVLKNYIDVYVCIDMVCGDTRNELESEE